MNRRGDRNRNGISPLMGPEVRVQVLSSLRSLSFEMRRVARYLQLHEPRRLCVEKRNRSYLVRFSINIKIKYKDTNSISEFEGCE